MGPSHWNICDVGVAKGYPFSCGLGILLLLPGITEYLLVEETQN